MKQTRSTNIFLSITLVILAAFATPARAQYLSDRLVPPQSVAIPSLPAVEQPVEPRIFGAEKLRPHLWSLPFGEFPRAAISLSVDQRPANWTRPVIDTPLLASDPDPITPTTPSQPIADPAYVVSLNPWQPALLARFPQPTEPNVRSDEDPGALSGFAYLTQAVPLATPNAAPLLRLAVPDPYAHLRVIRLPQPPADSDDSAIPQDRPAAAKLPQQ